MKDKYLRFINLLQSLLIWLVISSILFAIYIISKVTFVLFIIFFVTLFIFVVAYFQDRYFKKLDR